MRRSVVLLLVAVAVSGCGLGHGGPGRTATGRGGTNAGSADDPVVAAAGDIACSPREAKQASSGGQVSRCLMRETSDLLVGTRLQGVLELGDEQYESGALDDFQGEYRSTWGRTLAISHPAVGNHEYGTPDAAGYFDYFGARAGPARRGYYSFDIGAWHLIALNSNCSKVGGCRPDSPQGRWLAADLGAHRNRCTLAYWHHPRFSSGLHGDQLQTAPLWDALYAAGADVVLSGHDHDYERFSPKAPTGQADAKRGITQFVVGTGGKNHYPFAAVQPGSEVRNADSFGVLMLTLHPTSYQWRFGAVGGSRFTDSGTGSCH
jgi:Calcineurin-like phosphoesterase